MRHRLPDFRVASTQIDTLWFNHILFRPCLLHRQSKSSKSSCTSLSLQSVCRHNSLPSCNRQQWQSYGICSWIDTQTRIARHRERVDIRRCQYNHTTAKITTSHAFFLQNPIYYKGIIEVFWVLCIIIEKKVVSLQPQITKKTAIYEETTFYNRFLDDDINGNRCRQTCKG